MLCRYIRIPEITHFVSSETLNLNSSISDEVTPAGAWVRAESKSPRAVLETNKIHLVIKRNTGSLSVT